MVTIGVVVITRNRPAELECCLERLCALPDGPTIVVVDNGSEPPGSAPLRARFPDVGFVMLPANVAAAGRNVGVRMLDDEYVAFTDDDSGWSAHALARAEAIMEADPRIGLLAARLEVGAGARAGAIDPVSEAMAAGALGDELVEQPNGPRAVAGTVACATVVRRRAFLSVGGFGPGLGVGGEEQMVVWDLLAAGWKAVYRPEVVAWHWPAATGDRTARRATVTRNDLWAAWSRLPPGPAVRRSVVVLADGLADSPRATAIGVARAVRGASWALSRRAVLPRPVERARQVLATR